MNTEASVKNLDTMIAQSRMTRQDHVALQESLEFLKLKAEAYDLYTSEKKEKKDGKPAGRTKGSK